MVLPALRPVTLIHATHARAAKHNAALKPHHQAPLAVLSRRLTYVIDETTPNGLQEMRVDKPEWSAWKEAGS